MCGSPEYMAPKVILGIGVWDEVNESLFLTFTILPWNHICARF